MGKTAFNDVTGDGIKSGAGGKGNAGESQTKFDAGWDRLWKKTDKMGELLSCAAGRDGDCSNKNCPQLRDNEPKASGRHCPLDTFDYED